MGSEFSGAHGGAKALVTVDYYAVLSRAIEASKANPDQIRSAIYNMARVNLRREILWQNPAISDAELSTHLLALEDAIERVEATQSESYDNQIFRADEPVPLLVVPVEPRQAVEPPDVVHFVEALDVEPPAVEQPFQTAEWEPEPRAVAVDLDAQFEAVNGHEPPQEASEEASYEPLHETRGEVVILEPEPPMAMQSGPMLRAAPNIIVDYHPPSRDVAYAPEPPPRHIRNGIGSFIQLTAAALLAVAIFAVMTGQFNIRWMGNKQQAAVPPAPQPSAPVAAAPREVAAPANAAPAAPPFPLPATYGVYAIHNDKLVELDRFGIRVPDPRVLISPEIREPSRITLPDGKVSFVVFRRELANGAPEKVAVRVVAKVAREMTFTDGKATTSNVENLWRIRNNAFDFRVAPLTDSRDMIVIKPDADFVFPAGRYALVLNGQGYDFSIAGPITSPLQCLERIETVNGAMYSECRNTKMN